MLTLVLLGAAACWLRNRDILSDLYDYSSMIAAAGKVNAGLRPYTDFRSTMQSACYVLPRLVEMVAGRSYLGLTWGGLALSLGGALAIFALLRRQHGPILAALLTGAITWAGFAQHVIIFYNPLGLLCLAIVVFGLADPPRTGAWRSPRPWLVLAALIIGGANKVNFQALSLGLGGVLILRAGISGDLTWRQTFAWWGILLVGGIVAPVGLELWWTGASPQEWYFNVVGLAGARVGFISLALSPHAYLAPTYVLHKHVLFKPLHTVGLVVLIIVSVAAWRQIPQLHGRRVFALRAALLLLALGAGVGGVLLTITNIEIITLTSLGVLIGAIAVAGSFNIATLRSTRLVLGAAALLWMVVGGYAAWTGSRVLFGRATIDRSKFVRVENAPPALRYLEGVRLDANLYASLRLTARELARLKTERGNLSRVLFGPAMEWMERACPESILRGMPVWYDLGTSLRESDGPWLIQHVESKHIDRIFVNPHWESWPDDFRTWLDKNFRTVPLGRVVKLYERRHDLQAAHAPLTFAAGNPLALLDRTGSQIHVRTTRVPAENPPSLQPSPWGEFFGTTGGWVWSWERPCRIAEGTFIVVAHSEPTGPIPITWRIVADPNGQRDVLASGRVTLTAAQKDFRAPFRAEPNGRTLACEIEVNDGAANSIVTGWRDIRILDTGDTPPESVPPGLVVEEPARKFTLADGIETWLRVQGEPKLDSPETAWAKPFEAWTRGPPVSAPWHATLSIAPDPGNQGVTPIIMLLWYKSGRLELIDQFAPPVTAGEFTVEARMPAPGGWLGIVVRPISPDHLLNARLRVVRWAK